MTKDDLAREVAEATGLKPGQAAMAVAATIETIRKNVLAGENVYLRGFGTIKRILRAPKKARNISKGTEKLIPERFVPGIKFSKSFIEDMPKP